MVEILATLGRTMGFSFAAGINLYATVAILGLAKRYGWVALPEQFQVFDNDVVIGVALVLYVIEFVADKVPWVDSVWDAIHTVIRPSAARCIAVTTLGDASPTMQGLVALLGRHAGRRDALHQGRHPSRRQHEPGAVLQLGTQPRRRCVRRSALAALALKYPIAAALVVIVGMVLIIVFATWIIRALRRRWTARSSPAIPQP